MLEPAELREELDRLRELLREDLRKELASHELKMRDALKMQVPVAPPPVPVKMQEVLSETEDELSGGLGHANEWAKPEVGACLAPEQDLPGMVGLVPSGEPTPEKAKQGMQQRRKSLLGQGKEDDPQVKDIRGMKGGVFGGADHKETKLDEAVYDVRNFYKTTGCAQAIARSDRFEKLTLLVISINAVYIGVDADHNTAATLVDASWPYQVFDNLFCAFFTAELLIRFLAFESKRNCLKDRWFVFDALLVTLMIAETWVLTLVVLSLSNAFSGGMPTGPLRLLRLLRLSRLVRLLRNLPELLTLINGMRVAARAVSSALLLVILLNYVFGIVLLMFLSEIVEVQEHFGSLGDCMWTLMLDGTFMDSTKDILGTLRSVDNEGFLSWAMVAVFLTYVLLTNVTVMNMLIGIVCEVVSHVKREDEEGLAIEYMKENLRTLLTTLNQDNNPNISKEELQGVVEDVRAQKVLAGLQVKPEDVMDLTEFLFEEDEDAGREQEVTREELLEVILKIRGGRDISNQDIIDVRCDIRRIVQRQTGMVLREMGVLQKRMAEMGRRMSTLMPPLRQH